MDVQKTFDFFSAIKTEDVLTTTFQARVFLVEDRQLLSNGTPYFRLILCPVVDNDIAPLSDNDGREKICAIAIGSSVYDFVKTYYQEGKAYTFPPRTFRTRARRMELQSWSTLDFDLFFLPGRRVHKSSTSKPEMNASLFKRDNEFWSNKPWEIHPKEEDCGSWRSNAPQIFSSNSNSRSPLPCNRPGQTWRTAAVASRSCQANTHSSGVKPSRCKA